MRLKKILVLADIHANYPALKAISAFTQKNRFDLIVNAGDTTVYNTYPNQTIEWLRKKNCCSILGNTDTRVLDILDKKELIRPQKEEKRVMYFWTANKLKPANADYLRSLPHKTTIQIKNTKIGLFHGSPLVFEGKLFPDTPHSEFKKNAVNSLDIIISGHTHTPYSKTVKGVHFINPGSAGRMFDGDPRSSFAIIKITATGIYVEHYRIPYHIEDTVKGFKLNNLPKIYKKMCRQGRKLN